MSEQAAKEQYEVERRGWIGMDSRSDLSNIPENVFRETKNLTIEGGIHKTRPGSSRYGSVSFAGIVGEQHGMIFISTIQGEWCLAHIGRGLYTALAGSNAAPARVQNILVGVTTGAIPTAYDLDVSDSNHPSRQPFVKIQQEFGSSGYRVFKILFRSASSCKIIEYRESNETWSVRDPSSTHTYQFLSGGSYYTLSGFYIFCESIGAVAPIPVQIPGLYRIRVKPARIIDGVRLFEAPSFGTRFDGGGGYYSNELPGYVEFTLLSAAQALRIRIDRQSGLYYYPSGCTHWIVESTKVLEIIPGTDFSKNGNDPTIFYEVGSYPQINSASSGNALLQADIDLSSLSIPKNDNAFYQKIPGHDVSVFSGGLLFFSGGLTRSRIFIAGSDGISVHSEMYNPAEFIPADESDGKIITALENIGDDVGVWKESKTGIILNRDFLSPIAWRDLKIGATQQGCVSVISENQAVVLCHDGVLRVFNGSAYDSNLEIGSELRDLSKNISNISNRIQPETVLFIWHRRKLYLIHGMLGSRRALVLHADEGYGWTPWEDLTHFVNALAENELKWIVMDEATGFLFEQSALDPVYLDRDKDQIEWSRHDSPLWPRNRRNSMVIEDCFVEGIFGLLTEAHFELDEQRVVSAAVGVSPSPGVRANVNQRWFKAWPDNGVELRCHSLELFMQGFGYSLHRSVQFRIIEEASLGVPSVPTVRGDIFAMLPNWNAPVVIYNRFEIDAESQYDFSGKRNNLSWFPGISGAALRSHLDSMPPYGGEQAIPLTETDSGWYTDSWDGMDYLGDSNGACSKSQTFEIVFAYTGGVVYLEDAVNVNGTWQIKINADGSIQFQLFTYGATTKRWQWISAVGAVSVVPPLTPYVLQVSLHGDGDLLSAWLSLASSVLAALPLTRSALAADSGYVGNHVLMRGSGSYLSHFRRLARIRTEAEARVFHNVIKGLL